MKYIDRFKAAWKAETPKLSKWIRNVAGTVTTVMMILAGISGIFPTLNVPVWFSDYGWYIAGVAALITGFSGTRTVKKDEKDNR